MRARDLEVDEWGAVQAARWRLEMGVRSNTRDRMVRSAAVLIREHGVAGTTFAKVLEHSGGPRGSISFHFPGGRNEMVADALRWAGSGVLGLMAEAKARQEPATSVVTTICEQFRQQLLETDFAAGCPVGAAAQEVPHDSQLGPVVTEVLDQWASGLADLLIADGHRPEVATELSVLAVSAFEGAVSTSRVMRSTAPLDGVIEFVVPLLRARR